MRRGSHGRACCFEVPRLAEAFTKTVKLRLQVPEESRNELDELIRKTGW